MSAVAARGTVEMLSAPERVKVSTDVPSQPLSSTVYKHSVRPDDEILHDLHNLRHFVPLRPIPTHICDSRRRSGRPRDERPITTLVARTDGALAAGPRERRPPLAEKARNAGGSACYCRVEAGRLSTPSLIMVN